MVDASSLFTTVIEDHSGFTIIHCRGEAVPFAITNDSAVVYGAVQGEVSVAVDLCTYGLSMLLTISENRFPRTAAFADRIRFANRSSTSDLRLYRRYNGYWSGRFQSHGM